MSVDATKSSSTAPSGPRRKKAKRVHGPKTNGGSRQARRLTAAILEVLAGTRTPAEAAAAVGVSVPRYYQLESRALQGLLEACEPRKPGYQARPEQEIAALRKEVTRLRREQARTQALLRLSQRTVGLAAPPKAKKDSKDKRVSGKKRKRRRKPSARALKAAKNLDVDLSTPLARADKGGAASAAPGGSAPASPSM